MINNNKIDCNLSTKRINSLFKSTLKLKGLDEDFILDLVKLLKEQGANITYDENIIRTVAENGYFNVVKYLIENGGEIYPDLIFSAIKKYKVEVAKYLISKEPKFVLENDTILMHAIQIGVTELVKEILNIPDTKKLLNMGHLLIPIQNHQFEMFELLINYLKKYDLIDVDNTYCLELAIKDYQFNMVKELIDVGVNVTDDLLFLSISNSDHSCFKYILSKKEFSIQTVSEAIVKVCERNWINIKIFQELLQKPHYKWCVKVSKKLIRKNKKKEYVASLIANMNNAMYLLKVDRNIVKESST